MTSEEETRAFFAAHPDAPATTYYVNQADSHGFTPLMTAVCLSDKVAAFNVSRLLVEKVAIFGGGEK